MRKKPLALLLAAAAFFGLLLPDAGADVTLSLQDREITLRKGESYTVRTEARIPRSPQVPVDVFILADTTSSFMSSKYPFELATSRVVDRLKSSLDIRFGLGDFRDYPINDLYDDDYNNDYGSYQDYAYQRVLDFVTTDQAATLQVAVAGLNTGGGGDDPEAQLPALYQVATGAGQEIRDYSWASIPARQNPTFRANALKLVILWTDAPMHRSGDANGVIPYPGPSWAATVDALRAQGIMVAGMGRKASPEALIDLQAMAAATGALAPPTGVDCNGDGSAELAVGSPLVCPIHEAGDGRGIAQGITALVEAVALTGDVALRAGGGAGGRVQSIWPPLYGSVNLKQDTALPFDVLFTCPAGTEGTTTEVPLELTINGNGVAWQTVSLKCRKVIEVPIDIKPGDGYGALGCKSMGVIPVAVLSTPTFDATTVIATSVRFGQSGYETLEVHRDHVFDPRLHLADSNGDGRLDAIFHFDATQIGFLCTDVPLDLQSILVKGLLTGMLPDGTEIIGSEWIKLLRS